MIIKNCMKKNVRIKKFYNFKDFLNEYNIFMKNLNDKLETWEDWEGPSKYILIVVEKSFNNDQNCYTYRL